MSGTENNTGKNNHINGIPDRIWDQFFGPQGEISKIRNDELPTINKKLNDICRTVDRVESKIDKASDYEPRIDVLEVKVDEQERRCFDELTKNRTRQDTRREVVQEIHDAEDVIRKDEWKKFQRIIMLIGAACTVIGAGIAVLGFLVF